MPGEVSQHVVELALPHQLDPVEGHLERQGQLGISRSEEWGRGRREAAVSE
jgi:hypothetical protein